MFWDGEVPLERLPSSRRAVIGEEDEDEDEDDDSPEINTFLFPRAEFNR